MAQAEAQAEVARLRAELTAALALGGGGGRVDVASVVLGPGRSGGENCILSSSVQTVLAGGNVGWGSGPLLHPPAPLPPPAADDSRPGTAGGKVAAAGRSGRFRDSTFGPAQRGSSAGTASCFILCGTVGMLARCVRKGKPL